MSSAANRCSRNAMNSILRNPNDRLYYSSSKESPTEVVDKTKASSSADAQQKKQAPRKRINMSEFLQQPTTATSSKTQESNQSTKQQQQQAITKATSTSPTKPTATTASSSAAMEKNFYRKPVDWLSPSFYNEKELVKVCSSCCSHFLLSVLLTMSVLID
jgi:hypothetical protein